MTTATRKPSNVNPTLAATEPIKHATVTRAVDASRPPQEPSLATLDWPQPRHMRVIDAEDDQAPERGLVTLNNGEKILGTVLRMDFADSVMEFRPEAGPRRTFPFSSFRSLFLARTLEVEPIALAMPPGAVETKSAVEKRPCVVTFKDGTKLEADVRSIVARRSGLFLFVADYANHVLRWFIPASGVADYRVGEPLGQALRDHQIISNEALESGLRAQHELRTTRLGDYLATQGLATRDQVESAFERQKKKSRVKLGDVLVEDGIITVEQREAALAAHAADRHKLLGEILVDMGVVTREEIRRVLSDQLGVPSVNLARFQYDPNAVKAVSAELARKHLVMPLYRSEGRLAVAIENPLSWEALREIEFFTGLKIDPAMAAREDLAAAIAQFYGSPAETEKIAQLVEKLEVDNTVIQHVHEQPVSESDNTLVRLVNKMIVDAYDAGASDIHIESMPGDKPSRVRFRTDGVLTHYIDIPVNFRAAVVARLKVMSELDITERRRPQDGKIHFEEFGPRRVELRVVTMPTANGTEDIVMRILAAPRVLSLDQLGLTPRVLAELKTMAARSYGLLFVCGPTGSGKTTTLHSLLSFINTPQRKIWTVEDPIEITQDGLCQVQVNARLGLSFPDVLRSFLRADPDVIMVGETRDAETARTVIAASLTGHLVLSTMHTNTAAESIVRLLDLGVDSFNFSDALLGVVGQRLVRRLCNACKARHVALPAEIDALAHEYCRDFDLQPSEIIARWRALYGANDGSITLHAPGGCKACDGSGYKGRMGVYELLVASPAIRALVQTKAPSSEIVQKAIAEGMTTFKQNGIEKILQGNLDFKQLKESCM